MPRPSRAHSGGLLQTPEHGFYLLSLEAGKGDMLTVPLWRLLEAWVASAQGDSGAGRGEPQICSAVSLHHQVRSPCWSAVMPGSGSGDLGVAIRVSGQNGSSEDSGSSLEL